MTKDTFVLLAKFNKHANEEMAEYFKKLTNEDWNKEFPYIFNTIRVICCHNYAVDDAMLKRFKSVKDFKSIQDLSGPLLFPTLFFPTLEDYYPKRAAMDERIIKFVNELEDADLAKDCVYKDTEGKDIRKNFGGLLLNLFNHDSHHRGQISIYLEQLGVPNDFNMVGAVLD